MADTLASEQICLNKETGQECVNCRIEENLNSVQWGLMCNNSCDNNVPVMVCKGNDCNTVSVPRKRTNFMRTNGYKTDSKWWKADLRPTWKAICDAGTKAPSAFTSSGLATGGPVALPTTAPQPSTSPQPMPVPSSNPEAASVLHNDPPYQPLIAGPKEGSHEYDMLRCRKLDDNKSECIDAVLKKEREAYSCEDARYRRQGVTVDQCRKQVIEKYDTKIGWMEVDQDKVACSRLSDQIQRYRCVKAIERDKQHALESTQMWIDSNKDREPVPPAKAGIDKMIWDNLAKKAPPQGKPTPSAVPQNSPGGDANQQCYLQKSSCEQKNCGGSACQQCEEQWYDCRWQD
ncbi:MAG: hypothetical protein ACR65O_10445 [Methylomicrobium sp.]